MYSVEYRPVERQGGVGKTFLRGSQEFFWIFLNGASWCIFYVSATAGPPNVARPGVTYLLTLSSISTGLGEGVGMRC